MLPAESLHESLACLKQQLMQKLWRVLWGAQFQFLHVLKGKFWAVFSVPESLYRKIVWQSEFWKCSWMYEELTNIRLVGVGRTAGWIWKKPAVPWL